MTTLSNKQRKLLKKLVKKPLASFEEIPKTDIDAFFYLREVGYLKVEYEKSTSQAPNGFIQVNTDITYIGISEKGKAYLYDHRTTSLCFAIPTIISLASLAISIFALFIG